MKVNRKYRLTEVGQEGPNLTSSHVYLILSSVRPLPTALIDECFNAVEEYLKVCVYFTDEYKCSFLHLMSAMDVF